MIIASTAHVFLYIVAGDWDVSRRNALQTILEGSREVGRLKDHKAAYHFNAERFSEGRGS